MKKIFFTVIAAAGLIFAASAQERTVTLTVADAKGKPVKNLEVYSYVKGEHTLAVIEPNGRVQFSDIAPGDVIAVVVGNTIYEIPADGADSVTITMKSRRKLLGYSINGGQTLVRNITSYPMRNEKWVEGAVDKALSRNYRDLKEYIESRVPSVTPVMMGRGWQLTIKGTGGGRPALVVVDGTAYENFDVVNTFIKPWEVASIEIDRIGAYYGFRGQNGVVTITTRKE